MRRFLLATALLAAGPALADQRFEAMLAGHAILPAATFIAPPEGAPPGFAVSGRFTGPNNLRAEQVERVARRLRAARDEQLRVVVVHHPLAVPPGPDEANLLRGQAHARQA